MIRSRTFASFVFCISVFAAFVATDVRAADYVVVGAVNRIADRCTSQFGEGFVDSGNGLCAQVGNHNRFYVAPRNAGMNAWTSGPASSATMMRTDSATMVPGAPTQHLRVRGNLDSYSPFR